MSKVRFKIQTLKKIKHRCYNDPQLKILRQCWRIQAQHPSFELGPKNFCQALCWLPCSPSSYLPTAFWLYVVDKNEWCQTIREEITINHIFAILIVFHSSESLRRLTISALVKFTNRNNSKYESNYGVLNGTCHIAKL